MPGVNVKMQPDIMASVADTITAERNRIAQYYKSILQTAESLQNDWQGEAASLYQTKLKELDTMAGQVMLTIFDEYIQDLRDLSGIYKHGEDDATRESESLPTEGIF